MTSLAFIMDVAPPVDRAALVRRGATPWAPPSSTGCLALRCSAYFSPSLRYASKALRHAANNVRQFGRRSSDLGVAELARYARGQPVGTIRDGVNHWANRWVYR